MGGRQQQLATVLAKQDVAQALLEAAGRPTTLAKQLCALLPLLGYRSSLPPFCFLENTHNFMLQLENLQK
jgi:hypothetical protein